MMRVRALLLFAFAVAATTEPVRTVIIVRHAERASGMSADAPLTEAGRCRAESLVRILADAGIQRIFATDVARTQQTAEPVATKLGIKPVILPAKDIDGLVSKLRSDETKGTAFVVGHSNTVPEIVSRLGAGSVSPIADDEYNRLFVVTLTSAKAATAVTLRYPGCVR